MRVVFLCLLALGVVSALPSPERVRESLLLQHGQVADVDDEALEFESGNFTSMPGFQTNATTNETVILPSPTPDPLTEAYRELLKEDVCKYLFELSEYLQPRYFPDEPIRENLLLASEAVGCWIEGAGANYLKPENIIPVRGDHGPWPTSGFPYVVHAIASDKRNFAINIKYDDEHLKGIDLYNKIGYVMGSNPSTFTVYYNSHPIPRDAPLSSVGLHFQATLQVDFDQLHFKSGDDGVAIQGGFFAHLGDSQRSMHGIAP